jgi:hypothetical protein
MSGNEREPSRLYVYDWMCHVVLYSDVTQRMN